MNKNENAEVSVTDDNKNNENSVSQIWRQHHMMALTQLQICNLKN